MKRKRRKKRVDRCAFNTAQKIANLISRDSHAFEKWQDLMHGPNSKKVINKELSDAEKRRIRNYYNRIVCSWDGVLYDTNYLAKAYFIDVKTIKEILKDT